MTAPAPDAPWWEHFAWAVVRAHQPAPARAKRETAPPMACDAVLRLVAKHARPRCRRCGRDVEKVMVITREAGDRRTEILVECHGEQATFAIADVLVVSASEAHDPGALLRAMRCRLFSPTPIEYGRFDDPRDGYGEGFEDAHVRSHAIPMLTAAVMVRKTDKP